MKSSTLINLTIILIVLFFIGGFLFKILFKLGLLAIVVLVILFLARKVMGN